MGRLVKGASVAALVAGSWRCLLLPRLRQHRSRSRRRRPVTGRGRSSGRSTSRVTPDTHALADRPVRDEHVHGRAHEDAGTDSIWVDGEVCVTNNGNVATENLVVEDRVIAFHDGGQQTLIKKTPLDLSSNPVLDPGESACYPYSFPLTPYPARPAIRTRRGRRSRTIRVAPASLSARAPSAVHAPGVADGRQRPGQRARHQWHAWLFSASGSVTYTKTFTCATRTRASTTTRPRSWRPARATTRRSP